MNKENNKLKLPVINEKPMLQRQASAILGGVIQARYNRPESKGADVSSQLGYKPSIQMQRGPLSPGGQQNPLMPRYQPLDYMNRY